MRNIAIPIKEMKAAHARIKAKAFLEALSTISAIEKAHTIKVLESRTEELVNQYAKDRERGEENTKEFEDKIAEINKEFNRVSQLITDEEKAESLADIAEQDAIYNNKYGIQKLTAEDIAQRNADEIRHNEYLENEKYIDDRSKQYPGVPQQLDAIWKALEAIPGLPAETTAMINKIKKVKSDNPKPGGGNG